MKLNKLSLKDKRVFVQYLRKAPHELGSFAFENIYIWENIFSIDWLIIKDSLCIFFKDNTGSFLYLPPLSKEPNPEAIRDVFLILDSANKNKDASRIENIEEKDLHFYRNLGYKVNEKYCDYLCNRSDLADLKGGKFKSKRAAFNYFVKNYKYTYLTFSTRFKDDCSELYDYWMKGRMEKSKDTVYQGMLKDSREPLKILLSNYSNFNLEGRVVKINKEIKAFTFGYELNKDTFCILYEITDLSIKGLAQFIFRKFCTELKGYKYINIMDDSGLENLKKVKLSYHPTKLVRAYIATRKYG